ncbi:MAG: hypothetical protein JSV00_06715 [bacterium]|nr:MAG: hypothetical protein JSV00_06715 [bacterium]
MKGMGRIMKILVPLGGATLLLLSCGGGGGGSGGATQAGWTPWPSNPVVSVGDGFGLAIWNDPSVVVAGSTYVMYLTSSAAGAPAQSVQPYLAISAEGVSWQIYTTPLLALGPPGSFDADGIETPSVVSFGNTWHMYYTAVETDLSGALYVGHAVSPDGIVWTKDPANPVLAPTGDPNDWNGAQVAEPGAAVFGSQIYLYFTAVGLRAGPGPTARMTIGLAVSNDGSVFGSGIQVLEQGTHHPASEDYVGYSTPSAMVMDGRLHLFYDVARMIPDWTQVEIRHASSDDGLNWTEDDLPIFVRESFTWTRREIRSPCAVQDGGLIRLWFAGDDYLDNGLLGIGYATAGDAIY